MARTDSYPDYLTDVADSIRERGETSEPIPANEFDRAISEIENTRYIAGDNIQISADNVISATDTTYTAGANITISEDNVISSTGESYTAGDNITISDQNVISATDTRYTAGSNISISGDNVISTPGYTAGTNITIDDHNVISNNITAGYGLELNQNGVLNLTSGLKVIKLANGTSEIDLTISDRGIYYSNTQLTNYTFKFKWSASDTEKTIVYDKPFNNQFIYLKDVYQVKNGEPFLTLQTNSGGNSYKSGKYNRVYYRDDSDVDGYKYIDFQLATITNYDAEFQVVPKSTTLPTVNSHLTNKQYVDSQISDVMEAIGQITSIQFEIVSTLPATGDPGVIYLVLDSSGTTGDTYKEYIYVNGDWECLGSTNTIDLSDYATTQYVDGQVQTLTSAINGKQDTLTAGTNIAIDPSTNTISATDTTYTAGTNVSITNNVISATDTTYTAGDNITINGTTISSSKVDIITIPVESPFGGVKTEIKKAFKDFVNGKDFIVIGTHVDNYISNKYGSCLGTMSVSSGTYCLAFEPVIYSSSDSHYGLNYDKLVEVRYLFTYDDVNDDVVYVNKYSSYKQLLRDGSQFPLGIGNTSSYTPTANSYNPATTKYVDAGLATKQDTLTAGTGITIDSSNVISATGGGGGSAKVYYIDLSQACDNATTLTTVQSIIEDHLASETPIIIGYNGTNKDCIGICSLKNSYTTVSSNYILETEYIIDETTATFYGTDYSTLVRKKCEYSYDPATQIVANVDNAWVETVRYIPANTTSLPLGITNVTAYTPTVSTHPATKGYVDTTVAPYNHYSTTTSGNLGTSSSYRFNFSNSEYAQPKVYYFRNTSSATTFYYKYTNPSGVESNNSLTLANRYSTNGYTSFKWEPVVTCYPNISSGTTSTTQTLGFLTLFYESSGSSSSMMSIYRIYRSTNSLTYTQILSTVDYSLYSTLNSTVASHTSSISTLDSRVTALEGGGGSNINMFDYYTEYDPQNQYSYGAYSNMYLNDVTNDFQTRITALEGGQQESYNYFSELLFDPWQNIIAEWQGYYTNNPATFYMPSGTSENIQLNCQGMMSTFSLDVYNNTYYNLESVVLEFVDSNTNERIALVELGDIPDMSGSPQYISNLTTPQELSSYYNQPVLIRILTDYVPGAEAAKSLADLNNISQYNLIYNDEYQYMSGMYEYQNFQGLKRTLVARLNCSRGDSRVSLSNLSRVPVTLPRAINYEIDNTYDPRIWANPDFVGYNDSSYCIVLNQEGVYVFEIHIPVYIENMISRYNDRIYGSWESELNVSVSGYAQVVPGNLNNLKFGAINIPYFGYSMAQQIEYTIYPEDPLLKGYDTLQCYVQVTSSQGGEVGFTYNPQNDFKRVLGASGGSEPNNIYDRMAIYNKSYIDAVGPEFVMYIWKLDDSETSVQ